MTLNPQAAPDGQHIVAVDKAEVISADASGPSGTEHAIVVSPEHTAQNKPALVMENAGGDVTLPTEGEDVLIGQTDSGTFYVLGRTYQPDDTVPTLAPGERRIGHPLSDSAVTLHKDGTVTIEGDMEPCDTGHRHIVILSVIPYTSPPAVTMGERML